MYRPAMPAGLRRFLEARQLAVLGTRDAEGRLWASMRSGPPGFLRAVDERTLEIGGYGHPDDPLLSNLAAEEEMGLIAIDLAARQRVRLNGTARVEPDGRIALTTGQVYGNCPQYIAPRPIVGEHSPSEARARASSSLDEPRARWIRRADTFFIATAHPEAGADASHRGGPAGFVQVDGEGRLLLFPDYPGNNMFNSLGNITSYPRAGLLFPDFGSGAALLVSGGAQILWDDPRISDFPGAQRLVEIAVEQVIELPQATRLRFQAEPDAPTPAPACSR
jgi:predicted pyridoxine 5'-phosphate oxidase superfamily flavin-nucleotide-binding protein